MLLSFPEVNVIAAHMAYGYRPQLCSFGWQRPNLYTDISVSQDMAKTDYPKFARIIREVMDAFGLERVLFGTDSPFTWGVLSEKDFVTAIKYLATKAPDDAKFTQNEIEMLLGANAKKLLNI
jgi:predicted TIM-barrel fold metal-dependent hydrolase